MTIPDEHVKQIKKQLEDYSYFEFRLIGLGRFAPIWEVIFKCVDEAYNPCLDKVKYYRSEVQCDEDDTLYFEDIENDLAEVEPFESTTVEWRFVE